MKRLAPILLLGSLFVLWPLPGHARQITVPVELSTGPAVFHLGNPTFGGGSAGPLAADQPLHFGWRLELAAVIDEQWAREHPGMVPQQYRARLKQLEEVRYRPFVLAAIPRSLIISPKIWNTGVYGATWDLLGVGAGLRFGRVRLGGRASLLATYAFIHSDAPDVPSPTHFLRPGVDLGVNLRADLTEDRTVGLSIGWDSHFYVPQTVGGPVWGLAKPNLWHIGEGFVMLHVQFPYRFRR